MIVCFSNAYRLACLGETSTTWEALGHACIEQGDFNLAKKCFSRIRDVKYLNLLSNYEVNYLKISMKNSFVFFHFEKGNCKTW
jgi:hypothetical protein